MSVIDIDALLAEVSPEHPCGENLEEDPVFLEMERAAHGKAEQQMGDQIIEAEPPDWRALKKHSLDIFQRSKDLRAAVNLTRALITTDGYHGLHDGLKLIEKLCTTRWPELHPLLDPEDDDDPNLMRVNIIEALANRNATLTYLEQTPLVVSKVLGRFGLHEIAIASGDKPLPENFKGDPPTTAQLDGAFMEVDLDELTGTADAVNDAIKTIAGLDKFLAGVMDIASTPNLSPLQEELVAAQTVLREPLQRRGIAAEGSDGAGGAAEQQASGEISNREDVVRALDRICEFYRRQEPASPVPMILQRAKRLVPKDFMEIVADLAPSGIKEVKLFAGSDGEDK